MADMSLESDPRTIPRPSSRRPDKSVLWRGAGTFARLHNAAKCYDSIAKPFVQEMAGNPDRWIFQSIVEQQAPSIVPCEHVMGEGLVEEFVDS
jgi:hypothetical protein